MGKAFSWSYSALSSFETCPLQYKYRKEKHPRPPNKYLERGIAVHEQGEHYLKGIIKTLPSDYQQFSAKMKFLKKVKAEAEGEYAFNRKWERTKWFGDDTWLRAKLDAIYLIDNHLTVIDFKTGRPKDSYKTQVPIYVVAGFAAYPTVQSVNVEFWYLDHGEVLPAKPLVYVRQKTFNGLRNEFTARAARIEKAKIFNPKPGAHCSFCDYSKRKGGPCQY